MGTAARANDRISPRSSTQTMGTRRRASTIPPMIGGRVEAAIAAAMSQSGASAAMMATTRVIVRIACMPRKDASRCIFNRPRSTAVKSCVKVSATA